MHYVEESKVIQHKVTAVQNSVYTSLRNIPTWMFKVSPTHVKKFIKSWLSLENSYLYIMCKKM